MPARRQAPLRGVAIVVALCALGLAAAPPGMAARLVGGSTQRAIARAFTAQRSHRGQVIVSIRRSSVSGAWAVVRSVTPQRAGRRTSGATPALRSSYYHLVGRRAHPAPPPPAVKRDLARRFAVAVVYRGSGAESISYSQLYRSGCQGLGGFTDSASDTVTPMSWTVRYVVVLDDLLSAVRGAAGPALTPNVAFDAAGSRISASETVSRTLWDRGCNQKANIVTCTRAFSAGGLDPGGQLSFPAGSGLDVGLPLDPRQRGACNPDNFTLGPSLWDSGGAAALVARLPLLGGTLPANPYAPIRVSWPRDAAMSTQGFAVSPCQGDAAVCRDSFKWQGTVALQALPGT